MSTPKQQTKTIETPFGDAILRDMRAYDEQKGRAQLTFNEVTVNNKTYKDVNFTIRHFPDTGGSEPIRVYPESYPYAYGGGLTDSARKKLQDVLSSEVMYAEYMPYLDQLDAADVRASLKRHLQSRALYHLSRELPSRGHALYDLSNEVMDEVLRDALNARSADASYTEIYLSK